MTTASSPPSITLVTPPRNQPLAGNIEVILRHPTASPPSPFIIATICYRPGGSNARRPHPKPPQPIVILCSSVSSPPRHHHISLYGVPNENRLQQPSTTAISVTLGLEVPSSTSEPNELEIAGPFSLFVLFSDQMQTSRSFGGFRFGVLSKQNLARLWCLLRSPISSFFFG
jgi:hypothetical protein